MLYLSVQAWASCVYARSVNSLKSYTFYSVLPRIQDDTFDSVYFPGLFFLNFFSRILFILVRVSRKTTKTVLYALTTLPRQYIK